jgi:signal transduction histidine kinase
LVATLGSGRRSQPVVSQQATTALGLLGAGVCTLAVAFVVAAAPADQRFVRGVAELLVVGVPILAGLYALRTPHSARCGAMLLTMGFAWSLTALGEAGESLPYSIGRVAGWLVFPGLIFLMLTFPDGRIERRRDGLLLIAVNLVVWLLYIGSAFFVTEFPEYTPWATCRSDCPENAFLIVDQQPAFIEAVITPAREILAVLLLAGVVVSTFLRCRRSTPLQRQTMWPVVIASGVSVFLLVAFLAYRRAGASPGTVEALGIVWGLSLTAIAAAFLAGLLRRRLLFGQVLADLAGRLSEGLDLAHVRDGLANALNDPSLEVLVADGPVRWHDHRGRAGPLPQAQAGREVTIVGGSGAPAVALVHDAGLRSDDELLTAVASLVLGAVRHHNDSLRLASALRQLDQSRRRIAEAADRERARIERDLHDGAQQRLMALRIRLSLAEELLTVEPAAGITAVHELGEEVERTLDELRSLAHGVYPAVLNDRGLSDALRSVAAATPIPVHVYTQGLTRHSMQIETALYFTCVEALQNAIKHASGATGVWISLAQDDVLTLEVRDDGVGFTPPQEPAGDNSDHAGLRNMRDRLEAVGGQLTIDAAPGRGTRVIGRLALE